MACALFVAPRNSHNVLSYSSSSSSRVLQFRCNGFSLSLASVLAESSKLEQFVVVIECGVFSSLLVLVVRILCFALDFLDVLALIRWMHSIGWISTKMKQMIKGD